MSTVANDYFSGTFTQGEHEKHVAAIQSLLFLGTASAAIDEHVNYAAKLALHQNFSSHEINVGITKSPLSIEHAEGAKFTQKKIDVVSMLRNGSSDGSKIDQISGIVSGVSHGFDGTDDLSNAVMSASLVLASVSRPKKRLLSNVVCEASKDTSVKRRRGPTPSSTKADTNQDMASSSSASSSSLAPKSFSTDAPTIIPPHSSNHLKNLKSSADRYRERNVRRKQFFGNKLMKVVDLLRKYRLLLASEVR